MTEDTNPATDGEGTGEPGAAALSGDPDIAALEATLKEKELALSSQTSAELNLAHEKIVELEKTNKELTARMAVLEKDTRVKELTQKIETLSKQPVIHTVVSGAPVSAQPVELDSGDFEQFSALDFTED